MNDRGSVVHRPADHWKHSNSMMRSAIVALRLPRHRYTRLSGQSINEHDIVRVGWILDLNSRTFLLASRRRVMKKISRLG